MIPIYAFSLGTVIYNQSSDSLWTFCTPSGASDILAVGQSTTCAVTDTAIQVANIQYQPSCMDCHNQTAGDFSFGPKTAESYYGSLPPVPGGDAGTVINFHNIGAGNTLTITGTPGVDIPNAMTFAKSVAPLADFDMYSSTIHVSNATAYPLEFLCEPSSTFYTVNAESGSNCPSYTDTAIYIGYNVDPSHISLGGIVNLQGALPDNAPTINPSFNGQLGSGHSWLLNNINGLDANILITGDPNNTVTMTRYIFNESVSLNGGIRIVNTTQYPMDVVCVPDDIIFEVAPGVTKYCPTRADTRAFIGYTLPSVAAISADSNVVRHQGFPDVNVTENITGGMGNQKAWDLEGIGGFDTLIIKGDPTSPLSNAVTITHEARMSIAADSGFRGDVLCEPSGVYNTEDGGKSINVNEAIIGTMVGGAVAGVAVGTVVCTAILMELYATFQAFAAENPEISWEMYASLPIMNLMMSGEAQACYIGTLGSVGAALSIAGTISGIFAEMHNQLSPDGLAGCYYDDTAIYEGSFDAVRSITIPGSDNEIYGDVAGAANAPAFTNTMSAATDDYAVQIVNFQNLTHRTIYKYCSQKGSALNSCDAFGFNGY